MIKIIRAKIDYFRERVKRKIFLRDRREAHPLCTIADSAELPGSKVGEHVVLHDHVLLLNCTVGSHTYFAQNSTLSNVKTGNFCSIGSNVAIGLSQHPSQSFISTYPGFFSLANQGCLESFVNEELFDESPKETQIGHDVWIGNNVIIPGGVHIGNGAIIAAGSVVVKDVSEYSIVGGNPATHLRFRFPMNEIKFLLETEWWHWDADVIKNHAHAFQSIEDFRNSALGIQSMRSKKYNSVDTHQFGTQP